MGVATFTWLDHRDEDAERVREALKAFEQPGMIDPLGFGAVRDAFSDLLFPGVSTVQTRARYFLFVPWVYERLDQEGVRPSQGMQRARDWEVELIAALVDGSEDLDGVIGRQSGASTKQLPSQIYWGGLGTWGIRRFRGTRRDYVAGLDRRRTQRTRRTAGRDLDDLDVPSGEWHDLPERPDGIFDSCDLGLTRAEAEYLRGRIVTAVPDSYLADIVRDGGGAVEGDWPWSHLGGASARNEEILRHARHLSLVVWGANVLYNHILEDRYVADGSDDFGGRPDELLGAWLDQMAADEADVRAWAAERSRFWTIVGWANRRAHRLRPFVDWWLDVATSRPDAVLTDPRITAELVAREAGIKGHRARLSNKRARETSQGMQGHDRMAFRWRESRAIVGDVMAGLA